MANRNSLQRWGVFINRLRRRALASSDADEALRLAAQYGFLRRLNSDGIYTDTEFEAALWERLRPSMPRLGAPSSNGVMHVLTETYDRGGHTKLALAWLRIRAGRDVQRVHVTRRLTLRSQNALDDAGVRYSVSVGTPTERLAQLMNACGEATTIVLHIHPEDIIGALAARAARDTGRRVLFLNHSDHLFSFGVGVSDCVLEVSGFGWLKTRAARGANRQSFIGIPLDASYTTSADTTLRSSSGPILTVGSTEKYRPNGHANFPEFINLLARRVDNDIHLIGPSGLEPWWTVLASEIRDRVIFHGPLPFDETRERVAECAAYVDSFPITGGTMFQQAFMSGAPVFGLTVGGGGYGLVDVRRSATLDDLVETITDAITNVQLYDAPLRARVAAEFSDRAISDRIETVLGGGTVSPPPDLLATAGDLGYFEADWRARGPFFAVLTDQIPRLPDRVRLLFSARMGHFSLAMARRRLFWFLLGHEQ